MILLLSNTKFQHSMDEVIEWLYYYKHPFTRINGLNENELSHFEVRENNVNFIINGKLLKLDEVESIWFYRWSSENKNTLHLPNTIKKSEMAVNKQLAGIKAVVSNYFFSLLEGKYMLAQREISSLNKIYMLKLAKQFGIMIPKFIFSDSVKALQEFTKQLKGNVITKSAWEMLQIEYDGHIQSSFTAKVDQALTEMDEETKISPTLLQAEIIKQFEIRAFYLEGTFYSMAIFSQKDPQTQVDFRNYNHENPNRTVPFQLPNELTKKLAKLFRFCGLNTGSVDLIYSREKVFVFLEINPVGQYGMTSKPCNYFLEEKIAKILIKNDQKRN